MSVRKTMEQIQADWQAKYGHLSEEDRAALIEKEMSEGLARLEAAGIKPSMSGDELMRLTRPHRFEDKSPDPDCMMCDGTGLADSGGTQPWGEPISIRCDCTYEEAK